MTLRVLVLTPYLYGTTPGPRSSFELWEPVLRQADIHLDYAEFETEQLREILQQRGVMMQKAAAMGAAYACFLGKLGDIRQYDAVLVNREATLIGPALIERWITRRGTPLIYWLDDPLYIPYRSRANGALSYLKFFGKVKTLCKISTAVMTNFASHSEFARRYNERVWEIPSLVDGERYSGWLPPEREQDQPVCVGWSGSSTSAVNLSEVEAPLRMLSARNDVELCLIGARESDLSGVPHTSRPWQAPTEVEDLRRFDVGLVPLIDHPWAPHKFYLKLVQYMALGIPPVASPLGSNPLVIEHGKSGFLARDHDEWLKTLARLIDEPDLRETIGKRAAEVAHERYTVKANAEKIVSAFQEALGIA